MDAYLWMELVAFLALLGLSAFFSSSETALFSLNPVHLEQMRRERNPRIDLIDHLLAEPRRLIITILIGNELVNVAASVISAAFIIEFLGPGSKWFNLLVMVPILLLCGEITPKTLAIRNNVAFASAQCRVIATFSRAITPLRWTVRMVADRIITLIVGPERSRGNIITADMVRTLAHEAVGEGALDRFEAQFIDQIFDFGAKTVGEISSPRSDVCFLAVDASLDELLRELRCTWHTKVPVYDGNRDNVVGILHARTLLDREVFEALRDGQSIRSLLNDPYFVPESKQVSELFDDFRSRKLSIALTVDEYGGVTGLGTMEDLLECIFGDIPSPSERGHQAKIVELEDGRWASEGTIRVAEFNIRAGCTLPVDDAETVGGLLLNTRGELPAEGDLIEVMNLRFEVLEVADNRIRRFAWTVDAAPDDAGGHRGDG